MSTELDVVIIGGGVQGLLALNALTERGYMCALVNDGPLGGSQTLHSHSFLFTGFGASLTGKVVRIPDRNVPKRALVKALSRGHLRRILRGRAALTLEGQRVTAVTVRAEGAQQYMGGRPMVA